jgi:hypothetical protein
MFDPIGGIRMSEEFQRAHYPKKIRIKLLLLAGILSLPCFLSATNRPVNELLMYGGRHTPTVEENKKFIRYAAIPGWQYYYKGDLKTAMRHIKNLEARSR